MWSARRNESYYKSFSIRKLLANCNLSYLRGTKEYTELELVEFTSESFVNSERSERVELT